MKARDTDVPSSGKEGRIVLRIWHGLVPPKLSSDPKRKSTPSWSLVLNSWRKVNHASPGRWQEVTRSLYTSRAPTLCKALGTRCCRSHQDEVDSSCPRGAYNLLVNTMYIYTTGAAAGFSGAGGGEGQLCQAKCGVILKVILFKH